MTPSRAGGGPLPRRADIQGLRAIAVLMVVLYHADGWLRGGFAGVDVFFVVSGFVMARLLVTELEATNGIRLREFYARRARRILPALALVIVATSVVAALLTNPFGAQQAALKTAGAALGFFSNVYLYRHTGYFWPADNSNPFLHLWSLAVEEQFYLILPLGLLVVHRGAGRLRRFGTRRALIATVAVASLASFWLGWVLTSGRAVLGLQAPVRFAFLALPTRAWELGVGVLVALVPLTLRRRPASMLAGLVGAVALVGTAFTLDDAFPYPGLRAVVPVVGTALVIVAGPGAGLVTRALSWRPLTRLGDVSYGWYLWHWPAIVLAGLLAPGNRVVPPVAAALSLPVAVAMYRFVEHPLRIDQSIVGRRALRLALVCLVGPGLVLGALAIGAEARWGLATPRYLDDFPTAYGLPCSIVNRDLPNDWSPAECTWKVAGATGRVLVLGDQDADSMSSGAILAGKADRLDVSVWSRDGCPLLDRAPVGFSNCRAWQTRAMALVARLRPQVVVIANQTSSYLDPSGPNAIARADGSRPPDRRAARASWTASLRHTVERVRRLGARVVVVDDLPVFPALSPAPKVSVVRPSTPMPTLSLAAARQQRAPASTVIRSALAGLRGATVLDPLRSLCGPRCTVVRDGTWLYVDDSVLTSEGGQSTAGQLRQAIAPSPLR